VQVLEETAAHSGDSTRERVLLSDVIRNSWRAVANLFRLLMRRRIGTVVLRVGGAFIERNPTSQRRFPLTLLPWPPPPPSVEAFAEALERLANDPRVEGIVVVLSGLSAGPATVCSLRQAIARFRSSGKQATAYLHDLDLWSYLLACACDRIAAPESSSFQAAGVRSEVTFLKDTLALAGIEADLEAFAEYKVAPDTFRRSAMTEPHREMLESLVGSIYERAVTAIAEGRGMPEGQVRERLDAAPMTAEEARAQGLIDCVCYEDELASCVEPQQPAKRLVMWEDVRRRLVQPRRWHSRRAIGVISVEGIIAPGPSRQPPLPLPLPLPLLPEQAGSDTLVQQLRAAARSRHLAAVVLHIDSPGGSALASDLIWREVSLVQRAKPVVVYMSNRAASGGYYIAAPAGAIVAQPATLTGSIGIWGGKLVTRGLYEKLRATREVVSRGKAAGLMSDMASFTDEERAVVRAEMGTHYARFKARVAQGRHLKDDEVEAIARGRVWTGEEALARGLVDALGDLEAAAKRARELAGLDPRRTVRLINIPAPRHVQPPAAASGSEWLAGWAALAREGAWAMAPWEVRVRG
jgi:protease-4